MVNYSYPAINGTTAVFSCSRSGYVLTGPRSATCTGNGEWVPDPRQVQCQGTVQLFVQCSCQVPMHNHRFIVIATECGRPSVINMYVNVTYNSTSFNARLTLTCAEGLLPSGVPSAQCLSNGSWAPDPTEFTCKSTSGPQQGISIESAIVITKFNILLIILHAYCSLLSSKETLPIISAGGCRSNIKGEGPYKLA